MFLRRTLPAHVPIGDILGTYGLTADLRHRLRWDPRNRHLISNGQLRPDTWAPAQDMDVHIPIETTIRGTVEIAVDTTTGLRATRIGSNAPLVCTHGAAGRFERTLLRGANVAWVQTVRRDYGTGGGPARFTEFVDTGGDHVPFTGDPALNDAPDDRLIFSDTPCDIAQPDGHDMKWEGVLSIAIRHCPRLRPETVIVLAGYRWGFRLKGGRVTLLRHGPASRDDLSHQIRILERGRNQDGADTGADLNYLLAPPDRSIVDLR